MPDDMQTSHLIIWPRDKLGSGSFLFDSKLFLTAEKVMVSILNEEMPKTYISVWIQVIHP